MYKYNIKYSINQEVEAEHGDKEIVVNGSIDIEIDTLLTVEAARDYVRERHIKVIDFNKLIITNI